MVSEELLYLLMITCMLIRVSSNEVKWTVRDTSPKLGQDLTLFCAVDNCFANETNRWHGGPDDKLLMLNSGISTDKTKYNTTIEKNGFILTIFSLTVKDLNVSYTCSCGFDLDMHILYIEDIYKVDNLNNSTNGTIYVGTNDGSGTSFYVPIGIVIFMVIVLIIVIVITRHWRRRRLKEKINCTGRRKTENHENGEVLPLQTDQEDVQVGQTYLDPEHQFTVGDVGDPELEAFNTTVKDMKELKQMQKSVEERHLTSPTTAAAAGFPSIEEQIDADARSIYVGNVDYGATVEELKQHFHGCGSVNRVTIVCDKCTGHSKGYAYVEFAYKDSVKTAQALCDSLFRGRQIKVEVKRTNRPGISSTNRRPRGSRGQYGGLRCPPGGYNKPPRQRGRFGRL